MTDSQGRIIWHGDYSLWGKLKREQHPIAGFRGQQNLRFQGQYFDRDKFVGNKFEQRLR
ncbi:RHS domain-containing protein [Morganella morganii]|uniref:RHS domain-containing protein n=1 Tax=Morganella morganii TaxID=582 RepID=UPI003704B714